MRFAFILYDMICEDTKLSNKNKCNTISCILLMIFKLYVTMSMEILPIKTLNNIDKLHFWQNIPITIFIIDQF